MTLAAEQAAREGMERALRAERVQAWKERAEAWLSYDIDERHTFTADELVDEIGRPDTIEPGRNNVVGAVISSWSKRGLIEWTGRFTKSDRVEGHGNLQRVWRKLAGKTSDTDTAPAGSESQLRDVQGPRCADVPVLVQPGGLPSERDRAQAAFGASESDGGHARSPHEQLGIPWLRETEDGWAIEDRE